MHALKRRLLVGAPRGTSIQVRIAPEMSERRQYINRRIFENFSEPRSRTTPAGTRVFDVPRLTFPLTGFVVIQNDGQDLGLSSITKCFGLSRSARCT
jgi:hypothetical protein